MKDKHISIITLNSIEPSVIRDIRIGLKETFNFQTIQYPKLIIYDSVSQLELNGRYNSTILLEYISKKAELLLPGLKVLIITTHDLYSPIFSKMFGEAQLNGRFALISLYRLIDQLPEKSINKNLFVSRCQKEAIHEIGHTFGLTHCKDINCTMYPSSSIADTDVKSSNLCIVCNGLLQGLISNY
jgi:archaemetzincin